MHTKARGFTLIELLVVMAITAVLTALVLPSVSAAQDEARQSQCKNHLKQIGLAMHNYHDTYRSFPPGWVSKGTTAEIGPNTGWQTSILPFVEQAPLYNTIDFNNVDKTPENIVQTVVPTYRCPSDPMVELNPLRKKWATSSYSGNSGDERLPGSVDPLPKTSGIFWINSFCGMRNITDGTSNTILVGERCLGSGSGVWFGVTQNRNENDAVSDANHENQLNAGLGSFSSRHPGGAHFVLCDGAVRFISDEIESKPELGTFQKLANRSDGNTIGEF
jgi:prepilin-type N-terminal cleavage/methylation domain-containing protein/prepilin-type processing-associated H-X9-DG protein